MLDKGTVFALALIACGLATGCQQNDVAITAVEIATEEGILNGNGENTAVASIIQTGQADKMLEKSQAHVEHEIRSNRDVKVLVTRYKIDGETYRIEVRRQVKPMRNIALHRVRHTEYSQEHDSAYLHSKDIYKCLQNDSYEAHAEVAYRAWKGLDGKVRRIQVLSPEMPVWSPHENDLDLYIKTKEWPMAMMWIRGLTSDGRGRPVDGYLNYNTDTLAVRNENQSIRGCDGRWVMESKGPGVLCRPFINTKLYSVIIASAKRHPLNEWSVSDGVTIVSSRADRVRRIQTIRDMQIREFQYDLDWWLLYHRASRLTKWNMDTPE